MVNKTKVIAVYIMGSILWIAATDTLLNMLSISRAVYMALGAAKGAVFILLSAIFLYQLLKKREQLEKIEENETTAAYAHQFDA
ncbi:hypothetical protein LR69_00536 [Geobacillus sp. BCO2]|nr:hypothetical protein LR69_00536 [Geobacillus sp. BCO2]